MCQLSRISFLRSLEGRLLPQLGVWSPLPSPWLCALKRAACLEGEDHVRQRGKEGFLQGCCYLRRAQKRWLVRISARRGFRAVRGMEFLTGRLCMGSGSVWKGLWKQHSSHSNVSWMYFRLDVPRASLLPLKQVSNPGQKGTRYIHTTGYWNDEEISGHCDLLCNLQ